MGVFLGQLPPAEIARLKAELAETIIANFCYPRFLDYRSNTLRMRPVDRSKRQEVWLYLSSVDFTLWNRVDLMAPELQYQIERLFIQFVQRNRSFFGEQGRKRMGDVRMLITSASGSVVDGLRGRISGQSSKTGLAFGSPRSVVSWAAPGVSEKPDLTWEQIANATMLLQQQLQEVRGEIKSTPVADQRPAVGAAAAQTPRRVSPGRLGRAGISEPEVVSTGARVNVNTRSPQSGPLPPTQVAPAARVAPANPVSSPAWQSAAAPTPTRPEADQPTAAQPVLSRNENTAWPAEVSTPVKPRGLPLPNTSKALSTTNPRMDAAPVGAHDEDVAIFEQMRQQLVVWLRVEAVRAGLDITGLGPAQLLELLRQDEHLDETRLQVVSTLLDLASQVIQNRSASSLDYKQGLMLYLMHTRRSR
ncbi:MAG TPA: hypothetical protein VFN23_21450 [Ktedonobacteraceae bacterium]|nr:hypothetical protein [Ktedonobacteraceae bacterium]